MIYRIYITFIAALVLAGFSSTVHAQSKDKVLPVKIRGVFHDPINPNANLFFMNEEGAIVPFQFRAKALSGSVLTLPLKGSLVLFDKEEINPENPEASVVASVKVPPNVKEMIVVVLRGKKDGEVAYKMLLLDDSKKGFPPGESRVLSLTGLKTAIQAGEHKIPITPGKITRVPPVKKVNNFNMAQTNFYYQRKDAWVAFTERQLQFIKAQRRLFIVYTTPGARVPTVSTIVDVTRQ